MFLELHIMLPLTHRSSTQKPHTIWPFPPQSSSHTCLALVIKRFTIANDLITTVANQGDIFISDSLALKNVFVRKLFTNLLSIQKLTDTNCSMTFVLLNVYFRNKIQGRWLDMLGRDGLYYLKEPNKKHRIEYCCPLSFLTSNLNPIKIRFGFTTFA